MAAASSRSFTGGFRGQPKVEGPADVFERRVNELLAENGIGWKLQNGKIETRGDEAFERSVNRASAALSGAGRKTAASELTEAIRDLSRKPSADTSGAVHHGLAALECFIRDVAGAPNLTLGELVKRKAVSAPERARGESVGLRAAKGGFFRLRAAGRVACAAPISRVRSSSTRST
jgi:hypothetical protein